MLLKLKAFTASPSRLNPFFRLKTTVSPVVHSAVSSQIVQNEMDIQTAYNAMNQFDDVIEETRLLFDSPPPVIPASQAISIVRSADGTSPGREKDRKAQGASAIREQKQEKPRRIRNNDDDHHPPQRSQKQQRASQSDGDTISAPAESYRTQLCKHWERDGKWYAFIYAPVFVFFFLSLSIPYHRVY